MRRLRRGARAADSTGARRERPLALTLRREVESIKLVLSQRPRPYTEGVLDFSNFPFVCEARCSRTSSALDRSA
jgi:hypothetical protein